MENNNNKIDEGLPLPSFNLLFDEIIAESLKRKKLKLLSTTGRWTSEEHNLFLQAVKLYGTKWKKMQPIIKTRNLSQIRTHAQKVFKRLKDLDCFIPKTTISEGDHDSIAVSSEDENTIKKIKTSEASEASEVSAASADGCYADSCADDAEASDEDDLWNFIGQDE